MTQSHRRFYSTLSLVSGVAFVLAGYITFFSIGLALLILAVASAVFGAILIPSRLRIAVAAVEVAVALFPWGLVLRAVLV